jgi:ABC-2 type transport system permease protein
VRLLRATGVTIILTYSLHRRGRRDGRPDRGDQQWRAHLVEDKAELMRKLGKKQLTLQLHSKLDGIPSELAGYDLNSAADGNELIYTYEHANRAYEHHLSASRPKRKRRQVQGSANGTKLAGRYFCQFGEGETVNFHAIRAIYKFEMARTWRTLLQSIVSPVISTSLYFVVFGAAIGSRITAIDGVSYGAFIVPGLIMLSLLTQSISNASFGIFFPKFTGTIYELLSAPVSSIEIVISYVGAAATKSIILGLIILATAGLFVPLEIEHPLWMLTFLVLTAVTFSLFGFILGIWADGFERLQIVPLLIITPLIFLGGSFYSVDMLPPFWQTVTLFNPVVYLISGFAGVSMGSPT